MIQSLVFNRKDLCKRSNLIQYIKAEAFNKVLTRQEKYPLQKLTRLQFKWRNIIFLSQPLHSLIVLGYIYIYVYINGLSKIKKKACNLKNLAIQRRKEKVPNRKFRLTLTSISSVQIHIHSYQNSVFQTNKHTKKENPKVGEKEEEET